MIDAIKEAIRLLEPAQSPVIRMRCNEKMMSTLEASSSRPLHDPRLEGVAVAVCKFLPDDTFELLRANGTLEMHGPRGSVKIKFDAFDFFDFTVEPPT